MQAELGLIALSQPLRQLYNVPAVRGKGSINGSSLVSSYSTPVRAGGQDMFQFYIRIGSLKNKRSRATKTLKALVRIPFVAWMYARDFVRFLLLSFDPPSTDPLRALQ
jgi:hypothetical protein